MRPPQAPSRSLLRRTPGPAARGFALPLVILLSLVATILVSVMLERQGAQRITIARAGDEYKQTHFARGVSEVVDTWLSYQGAKPLRDLLSRDGKAMDLELGDGSVLSVFMRDVQGLLLTDTSGLTPDDAADLRGALENLAESVPRQELSRFTRRFGPPAVSVLSAPGEVLAAIAHQVAGAQNADALLQALLEIRDKPRPNAQDLNQAAITAELDDSQRKVFTRLVVVDSAFFRMVVDTHGPNAGPDSRPNARYGAYVLPRSATGPRTRATAVGGVQRRSQIVGWERIDVP